MIRVFRLAASFIRAHFLERISPLDEIRTPVVTWPGDADLTTVNQAQFLVFSEIARWEHTTRSGALSWMRKNNCMAIAAAQTVHFLKPLKRFQRLEVSTKLIGWDSKWFFLEHKIYKRDVLVALSYVKGILKGKDRRTRQMSDMLNDLGENPASPSIPKPIQVWASMDKTIQPFSL